MNTMIWAKKSWFKPDMKALGQLRRKIMDKFLHLRAQINWIIGSKNFTKTITLKINWMARFWIPYKLIKWRQLQKQVQVLQKSFTTREIALRNNQSIISLKSQVLANLFQWGVWIEFKNLVFPKLRRT
jgi:hypothetical protein